MLNRVTIMGRLTRDPERKETADSVVTRFTLACERDFKTRSGEKQTDFFDVVCWRNTADFVAQYFSKGRMAIAEGRLQVRTWLDRDGNKKKAVEVVADNVYFGDSKTGAYQEPRDGFREIVGDDEPLPF